MDKLIPESVKSLDIFPLSPLRDKWLITPDTPYFTMLHFIVEFFKTIQLLGRVRRAILMSIHPLLTTFVCKRKKTITMTKRKYHHALHSVV